MVIYIVYIEFTYDDTFNHSDYMFYNDSYDQTKPTLTGMVLIISNEHNVTS